MNNEKKEIDRDQLCDRLQVTARKLEAVRGDSFLDSKNLCVTCKHATILRQASKNNREINCSIIGKRIADDIVECSDYANMLQLSLGQMTDIAVLLNNRAEPTSGYL